MKFPPRGYSKEFQVVGRTGKSYLLDQIPPQLWSDIRQEVKKQGLSMRGLILGLLREWLAFQQAPPPPRELDAARASFTRIVFETAPPDAHDR